MRSRRRSTSRPVSAACSSACVTPARRRKRSDCSGCCERRPRLQGHRQTSGVRGRGGDTGDGSTRRRLPIRRDALPRDNVRRRHRPGPESPRRGASRDGARPQPLRARSGVPRRAGRDRVSAPSIWRRAHSHRHGLERCGRRDATDGVGGRRASAHAGVVGRTDLRGTTRAMSRAVRPRRSSAATWRGWLRSRRRTTQRTSSGGIRTSGPELEARAPHGRGAR